MQLQSSMWGKCSPGTLAPLVYLKLQMDAELMLETAKKAIQQQEAVYKQQQVLKGVGEPSSLEAVHPQVGHKKQRGTQHQRSSHNGRSRAKQKLNCNPRRCTRCGKGQHARDKCPAKDAICHCCQRKGHYSALCYLKSVSTLQSEESSLETAFLDTMSSSQGKAWLSSICIGDQETLFKLARYWSGSDSCFPRILAAA